MTWVLIATFLFGPAVALVLGIAGAVQRRAGARPRWRLAVARRLESTAERLRRPHPPVVDPFAALRVQERLGAVADHVRRLEVDRTTYARAERIVASQLAYDQLLEEACRLARVDVLPHAQGDQAERFREEMELAARGWTW